MAATNKWVRGCRRPSSKLTIADAELSTSLDVAGTDEQLAAERSKMEVFGSVRRDFVRNGPFGKLAGSSSSPME
jgi:hypothetical protein